MRFFRRSSKKDGNTTTVGQGQTDPSAYAIVGYGSGPVASGAPAADAIPMAEGTVYPAHEATASRQIEVRDGSESDAAAAVTTDTGTAGVLGDEEPLIEDVSDEGMLDEEFSEDEMLSDEEFAEELPEESIEEDVPLPEQEPAEAAPAAPAVTEPNQPAEVASPAAPAIEDDLPSEVELADDGFENDVSDEIMDDTSIETETEPEIQDPAADFPANSTYPTDPALNTSAPVAPVLGWPPEGADLPPSPESAAMAVDTEFDTNPAKAKIKKKKKKKLFK